MSVMRPQIARSQLPLEQEAIRAKCFHPSGAFVEFRREEIEQSIPDRFEHIVRKYSERLAVKTRRHALTYEELNQRANRISHAILARRGAGQEPVALLLENDVQMISAILGGLKAGKFYVPLDPSLPSNRTSYIIKDAQANLIVTNNRNLSLANELFNNANHLLNVDSIGCSFSAENPGLCLSPDTLAYILYTSGSTGRPKGVVQDHRNVLHFVLRHTNTIHLCSNDRQTLLYSCNVNGAARDIFSALLNGASLFPLDIKREGLGHLADWLTEQEITIYCSVATVFRHFVSMLHEETEFPKLRLIKLGGEPIYKSDVELYKKHFPPNCILCSGLGSTETGTTATNYFLNRQAEITSNGIPIGYAAEDMEILLLDEEGKEVGSGDVGEIAVRSRYLFPGYWQKPDLTKAAFLPDPKGGRSHVYLTGDVGRVRPDGCLEHVGRKDFQMKVRGQRIEAAEIEMALSRLDSIEDAVVVAREDRRGDKQLVAYLVPAGKPVPNVSTLRSILSETLPDFMIPSAFVTLDALPVAPNGKIDRRALPTPDLARPALDTPFVAPRTSEEEMLAKIWIDLLRVEQIGTYDNFFDLGGHSLLATQVISRLRIIFQVEIALRSFFETPTVAGLADKIEVARRLEQRLEAPSIVCVSHGQDLALSFAQQRLWFLNQYEPNSAVYNIPSALRLRGSIHIGALEQSLNEIIRRHESLRTTFSMVNGEAVQVITPSVEFSLGVVDLSAHPEGEREEEAQQLVREEAGRPFDLARGPLFRSQLLQLGKDDHVLLLTMHHIVSDGWSMGVLHRELSVLYEAFSRSQSSSLAELPIQYADYAVWQRGWLQGELLERQLSYWKKQLGGSPGFLDLPTDHPRPAVQGFRGRRQSLVLSKDLSDGLKALSRKESVTLFMTLLAAFQTLLYRYTGQEDIAVGCPIAGRTRQELEGLIGFFVNTLVMRVDFSGNPTFRELLARVREVALGAYAHQELPFEKLVEEIQPQRNLSHSPLFQVAFAYQNTPSHALEIPSVLVTPSEKNVEATKFDLHLSMKDADEGIGATLYYATDLYDDATVARLLGHFQVLLEGIVADPDGRLSELPILTAVEERQLLVEWNDTRRDYPKDKCIHQLFEDQVGKSPDAVAVVFEDQLRTYGELNTRANQLARYLHKLGVGPEVLVGICMERSFEMVIGLLGILKAGGAYVPLDPEYPKERLALMLEDTRLPVLVTQGKFLGAFSETIADEKSSLAIQNRQSKIANPVVVCLDSDWKTIAQESEENLDSRVTGKDLAYVIYTSGSTGTPKGVEIEHAGLNNLAAWHQSVYGITAADRATQLASAAFDASAWELWPYLTVGASIHIPNKEILLFPSKLLDWLVTEAITICFLPTPLAEAVLEEPMLPGLALRTLLTGGDRLRRLAKRVLPFRLANNYGPTENTVVTTWSTVATPMTNDTPPSIGKPIANTKIYILDANLHPVPIGVPGELYIGGIGLARGYLRRPDLTAEKFIPHPFSPEPGARLYKTGDLARHLPDGNIEFLGRTDDQVKIRGFRIELGEIEAILDQHPTVMETVVMAREESPGDKRLVAYVVPRQEGASTISELRSFVKEKLPEYMVPSNFVFLDRLPLTPNGKVNRKALPTPDQNRPKLEEVYVAPRNPVEEILAEISAEVLRLDKVGIRDNFFELGGHSLLATQLVSRVRERLLVELPLRVLFENATVASLSEHIEAIQSIKGQYQETVTELSDERKEIRM